MNHSNAEFALLPPELWVHIFSYLPKHDLNQALQACKAFSSISKDSWKAVCYRRWHGYATLANHSHSTRWEQTFDLLSMREQEKGFVADVNAIWDFQSEINASHRAILVEWLFEVKIFTFPPHHLRRPHHSNTLLPFSLYRLDLPGVSTHL